MGYQESYVTTKNKADFTALCEYIRNVGEKFYEDYGAKPVETIIEQNGKQWIYFVGERFIQRNPANLLGYVCDDDEYNSQKIQKKMQKWIDKVVIVFTEDKNPVGIWKNAGDPITAKHEAFTF